MFKVFASALFVICLGIGAAARAQDDAPRIDISKIPASGAAAADFAPPGWEVEEQASGDLNGDGTPDLAIKLIEVKKPGGAEDQVVDRQRALVVVLAGKDGKLARAAVADKLLQCTGCGGAFYGVTEAPANVKIENGVIIVGQDHGARDVTEDTFRIRFDPASKRFVLIGFDETDHDRATGMVTTESTNYLTGVKISTISPAKGRPTTKHSRVSTAKKYLEDVAP